MAEGNDNPIYISTTSIAKRSSALFMLFCNRVRVCVCVCVYVYVCARVWVPNSVCVSAFVRSRLDVCVPAHAYDLSFCLFFYFFHSFFLSFFFLEGEGGGGGGGRGGGGGSHFLEQMRVTVRVLVRVKVGVRAKV